MKYILYPVIKFILIIFITMLALFVMGIYLFMLFWSFQWDKDGSKEFLDIYIEAVKSIIKKDFDK